MNSQSAKALKSASKMLDKTTALISSVGNELYKNSKPYRKQLMRSYPQVADNARNLALSTAKQTRESLQHAGEHLDHFSHEFGNHVRLNEKRILKVGFIYLIYKLFVADDKRVYETTTKVKACIKERPVQSAFIALGAGLLLGKLFR